MPKISIIIPCYFNEGNIPVTTTVLIKNEARFPQDVEFEYVFVDDGSKDKTYEELLAFRNKYPYKVKVIKLSRNFGASNASYCGIHYATGDCNVILAADLQDPPELLAEMYDYWKNGMKLVLAQKTQREDTFLTKLFSNGYHNLIRRTALPNSPKGGFDLWLFDKQLKEDVIKLNEKNAYLPYLFMWLGYPYVSIPYTRRKREIGQSGWTLKKKIKSFIDSFVAFTFMPIRLITIAGLVLGGIALIYGISVVVFSLLGHTDVEGWSSLMLVLLFVSAFQMIAIGILGEYLWRTLDASRSRPNFVVDEILQPDKTNENEN